MVWKITFISALLLAATGIPVLFLHPIGWGMLVGGVYLAFLSGEKAMAADSKGDLLKAARKLNDLGKFTVASDPAPYYDDWQKKLEKHDFRFVSDVRLASEKNALLRLMCDEENKIWVVLRKSFGRIEVTFYSFGANGGAVAVSNSLIPGTIIVGRALQEKHPKMSLDKLLGIVKDKVFDLEWQHPEIFPMGVLSFAAPSEFLLKLDEFKIRRSLAISTYDREKLAAWGIAPDEIDVLMKMRAVNQDEYFDYLPSLPAIRLLPAGEEKVRSHLGGLPDLPPDVEWPETPNRIAMNFIAQIDCSGLPRSEALPELPQNGTLLFFSAQEDEAGYFGSDPGDNCGWRVLFFETAGDLQRRNAPDGLWVFKEFPVKGVLEKTTLGGHSYAKHDSSAYHLMFGYPDPIQFETMPEDCAEVTQSMFPSKPEDWLLLLQVATDYEHSDLQFADMGTLFFWIRKEDLAAHRFDRVWMIMECY